MKENRKKNHSLQQYLKSISERSIFHDLLTPINVILGFAQEFSDMQESSSEQKEAIEIINQNRENLLNKMNQIIEFIQTEKGKMN